MKQMKHVKLFESFMDNRIEKNQFLPEDISKPGETVFMFNEGDGYRCTLLDRNDAMLFSEVANTIGDSGDDFYISSTNKPGIAYCLGEADGTIEFKTTDFATETSKYGFCISAGTKMLSDPFGMSDSASKYIDEDYVFTLKRGYVTTFNAHGEIESIPVKKYIEYLKTWDSYR